LDEVRPNVQDHHGRQLGDVQALGQVVRVPGRVILPFGLPEEDGTISERLHAGAAQGLALQLSAAQRRSVLWSIASPVGPGTEPPRRSNLGPSTPSWSASAYPCLPWYPPILAR